MKIYAILAVFALVASATVTAGPPQNRDNFGGGWLGIEPNPPATDVPNVQIVQDSLNTILALNVTGMLPGDNILVPLGESKLIFDMLADGTLRTTVVGGKSIKEMELAPLANGGSFLALITPATVSIDRIGNNPLTDVNALNTIDATMTTWGLITDLGLIGKNGPISEPPEVVAPPNVDTIAERISLLSGLDPIMDLVVVDPEDVLQIKTLEEYTDQTPTTSTVFTTVQTIQDALDLNALTSMNLNSLLSGLVQAPQALGAVDTSLLAANLVDLGYAFQVVDLPVNEPATLLDPDNLKLILVDGGVGKLALVPGAERLTFDNNLVTGLKNPQSTFLTSFVSVTSIGDAKTIGKTVFHPSLGNYAELLQKVDPLMKRGITTAVMPNGVGCKSQMTEIMARSESAFCMLPTGSTFPTKGADMMGSLINPDTNTALKNSPAAKALGLTQNPLNPNTAGLPGGPGLEGAKAVPQVLGMGTPAGNLKDMPNVREHLADGGSVAAFAAKPQDLSKQRLGAWNLPSKGFGALPEVDAVNPDAIRAGSCTGPCLPDHIPNLYDAQMEGLQAPAMPGINPVVPTEAASGVTGFVQTATSALDLIPTDLLNGLGLAATSEVQFRFIGEATSAFSNTGIPGVTVQVETSDPLGLAKQTSVHKSNNNGYVVIPMTALGKYTVQGDKDGFVSQGGSGQAPAPGSKTGKEFVMSSDTGNEAEDFVRDNAITLLLVVLVGVIAYVSYRNRKKNKGGQK